MGGTVRMVLQVVLKLVNSVNGLAGMALIFYSLWMIRDQLLDRLPWFICIFLGLGIFMCLITCSGHIGAESTNGHCLSCYMLFVVLLVLLEVSLTTDIFLNKNWEEDFPDDPTGKFDEFEDFVRLNFEICKWVVSITLASQILSILLAMFLRTIGPDRESFYDSDDDFAPTRLPLLRNRVQVIQSQHNTNNSPIHVKIDPTDLTTNR
ncbi:Tetraspanin-19 [Zostera marina]|uniref:Tetraspanin-19 n=1 Tax=Zostera marina TaxID=29655 RepID=A0A0K9NK15_ZOSMR|nr:Tetraspanin-19 [Zostera marina]